MDNKKIMVTYTEPNYLAHNKQNNLMKEILLRLSGGARLCVVCCVLCVTLIGGLSAQSETKPAIDDAVKNQLLLDVTRNALSNVHFSPVSIDDTLSLRIYKAYLKNVDYFKRLLTKEDIALLTKYKYKLDDEYANNGTTFYQLAARIIDRRIVEAESYTNELLSKPFDFTVKEKIELSPDKRDFPQNSKELKDIWRKYLKYDVMTRIYDEIESQEKAREKSDTIKMKSFAELETESRDKIKKRYDDWFSYVKKDDNSDKFAQFINAIASAFDPHTEYFPPKDKEDFDIRFSGELEGIGATLQFKDGYITISELTTGSPAWKSGELEAKDKIVKVAQGDGGEWVDIVDMRLDKAVKLIRGKKGTKVRLFVQKVDGTRKEVQLIRDKVVMEETYAKSAIIEDGNERVGYIYLPSFYTNFNDPKGRNSSVDMKAELEKLKAAGVKSIVLDLRNNGGGSLFDAIKIGGLFIPMGPIVQVKGRGSKVEVLSDTDSSVVYDGPLTIMINHGSASASEILAAAMQDYGRAVIVGSKSSYGKGTVQRFFDYDQSIAGYDAYKPLGAIKATIQKFYRINGGSTQLKGVTPDIEYPDMYKYIKVGEKELDNPMSWTEVAPAKYNKWNSSNTAFDNVSVKYKEREAVDTTFQLIDQSATRLKENRDKTNYTLNYDEFTDFREKQKEENKRFENIGKQDLGLTITPLVEVKEDDETVKERTKKWIDNLKKDIYLYQTVKVAEDLMKEMK